MIELEERVRELEKRMSEKDLQFAVINTKLSAILWGIGVIGTAITGTPSTVASFSHRESLRSVPLTTLA